MNYYKIITNNKNDYTSLLNYFKVTKMEYQEWEREQEKLNIDVFKYEVDLIFNSEFITFYMPGKSQKDAIRKIIWLFVNHIGRDKLKKRETSV